MQPQKEKFESVQINMKHVSYIIDIAKHVLSVTRLFADDSSLFYSASHNADIVGIINRDLQLLTYWAKQWLLTFNHLKTEVAYLLLKSFPSTTCF